MKSFRAFITEARSNPAQNPKSTAYSDLKPYLNDPDIYFSFTDIDKIGINPQSVYPTPLGIYAYPLAQVWKRYYIEDTKSFSSVPFATLRPYIWILRAKHDGRFVNDMFKEYSQMDFDRDLERMKLIWCNAAPEKAEHWGELVQYATKKARSKSKQLVAVFWNIGRVMATELTAQEIGIRQGTMWNSILRQCGYTGFADKTGKGLIHPAEPMQAVFLSKDAFTVEGKVLNKDRKVPVKTTQQLIKYLRKNPTRCVDIISALGGFKFVGSLEINMPYGTSNFLNTVSFEDFSELLTLVSDITKTLGADEIRLMVKSITAIRDLYIGNRFDRAQSAELDLIVRGI